MIRNTTSNTSTKNSSPGRTASHYRQPMNPKTYPAPWDGNLILACRRCQKRLRKSDHPPAFAKLKKWLKARARQDGLKKNALHVIEIPCQKICPKGGLVVLGQSQLASRPAGFSIIRNQAEMESFYPYAGGAPLQIAVKPPKTRKSGSNHSFHSPK
jgi:hypothetical protein